MEGHRTKSELAVHVLRERIRTGELKPGTRLRIDALKHELEMSPTPIREALRLLQADGLVDYRPHQGIIVSERSPLEVADVVRLRVVLEPLAVELAVGNLGSEDLAMLEDVHARYEEAVDAGRGTMLNTLNAEWHSLLYERSGSPLMREFIRQLWEIYPWRTAWATPGLVENSLRQHAAMMGAIRAGDAAGAAELMGEHIEGSRALVFEGIALSDLDSLAPQA